VNVGSATGVTTSFAAWGMFIDQNTLCDGTYLAPGTVTGPVFTNGGWNLGTAGAYIFTDPVGTASSTVGYQFSSNCFTSSNTSYKYKSQTIAPTYQAGLNLSQSSVALPPNDYSQQRAVLDGVGTNPNPVTPNDLHNGLRDIDGSQYPNGGTSSGVFLPYTVDSKSGALSFAGGGIYVEGSAQVTVSTSGASAEVWTIKQSSTTTTITVDSSANTTTISSGGTTKTIAGVPTQYDPASGAAQRAATMLYVNGSITSLSGPGQGVPAIQDGQAISIIAANNITVTGDILYKTEPVTKTQNQIPGTPADTLIPGSNNGQVLGIFTSTGDIQMQNSQSNGTLEIDASLATISQGGSEAS